LTYDLYGFGNALVDFEIAVKEEELAKLEIAKGLMTLIDESRQSYLYQHVQGQIQKQTCGGSAANTVITARQLGLSSFYACKVANDETGRFFYKDLKEHKVDSTFDHKELPEGTTGKCLILITPDAQRSMETYLGITETVSSEEVHKPSLEKSKNFYIEGYLVAAPKARAAAIDARKYCQANQIPVSLTFSDPNMVSHFREQMKEIIGEQAIDFIFANEDEAMTFTESQSLDDAFEELKKYAKQFIVTRSEKGCVTFDGKSKEVLAGVSVKAVDTTGAGDTFAGAFFAARKRGLDFNKSAQVANFAASRVVTKFGARLSEEQVAEVETFIKDLS
tara:strand:+ start:29443 stop:30444 length:1002 start_codon:yes stop_codon:yes gene_type:complete